MPAYQPPKLIPADPNVYAVTKNGTAQLACVVRRSGEQAYVHYIGTDKRLDEWLHESQMILHEAQPVPNTPSSAVEVRKRKRSPGQHDDGGSGSEDESDESEPVDEDVAEVLGSSEIPLTEEEYDILHHRNQIGAQRNFDWVHFGSWQIRTWYWSPYPITEGEDEAGPGMLPALTTAQKIAGVTRTTVRSHGRTSDLLAGGMGSAGAERGTLFVCDRCFKYMMDGPTWEVHEQKKCNSRHPPGRKVYERGAHIIWEVDGMEEKLYCQNLTLFGKLFIDHKTLYFDIDRFMFYIMTDADSTRDHVLAFFSKEKSSYDAYNLACIVTLPPYQRKGYGMLLIEFSYELSRRAGEIGTPERPLSDLGLKSYLTYWIATLIRFFRRLLSVLPPDVPRLSAVGKLPSLSSIPARTPKRKRVKGWDGEVIQSPPTIPVAPPEFEDDLLFNKLRTLEMLANEDGSATTRVIVHCSLSDLANGANLRIEDAAFALQEIGLLSRTVPFAANGDEAKEPVIFIDRATVERIAAERAIKRMCLELSYVLL